MGRNASHGSAGRPSCSPHVFADRLGCTFFFSTVSCSPVSIRWWGAGGVGLQEDTPFTEVGLGIHVPLPTPNSAPAAVNGRRLKFCVAITTFTTPALLSIFICWLFWWCFPAESNYACHDDGRNPSQDPYNEIEFDLTERNRRVRLYLFNNILSPSGTHVWTQ